MTYYYIATENQVDRFFYDANKWSETQGGTTPTLNTPSTSDDYVIGESSSVFVGTPETPIQFSFLSGGSYSGMPNTVNIYGYVRYQNMPIIRTCNISINFGILFLSGSQLYPSSYTHINVGAGCTFNFTSSFIYVDNDDDFNFISYDSTSTIKGEVRLTPNNTTYHLPRWQITNLVSVCTTPNPPPIKIAPQEDLPVEYFYFLYSSTVSTMEFILESPLSITKSIMNYSGSTSPVTLTGNAYFKFIGTNQQFIQFAAITAGQGVIDVELAKPSGNVVINGANVNINGYCGTDATGNLIPGQNPADAKVTVNDASDVTFIGTTYLANLTNNGIVGVFPSINDADVVIFNYDGSGSIDTIYRCRPTLNYYFNPNDYNVLSSFYNENNWSTRSTGTFLPVPDLFPRKTDYFQIGNSTSDFIGTSLTPLSLGFITDEEFPENIVLLGYITLSSDALESFNVKNLHIKHGTLASENRLVLHNDTNITLDANTTLTVSESIAYSSGTSPNFQLGENSVLDFTEVEITSSSSSLSSPLPCCVVPTLSLIWNSTGNINLRPHSATTINHITLSNNIATNGVIGISDDIVVTGNITYNGTSPFELFGKCNISLIGSGNQSITFSDLTFHNNDIFSFILAKSLGCVNFTSTQGTISGYCGIDNQQPTNIDVSGTSRLTINTDSIITTNDAQLSDLLVIGELNLSENGHLRLYKIVTEQNSTISGNGTLVLNWNTDTSHIDGTIVPTINIEALSVPSPPTITFLSKTNTETSIQWSSVDHAVEYILEVTTNENSWSTAVQYLLTSNTKMLNNLTSNTRYYYRVYARNFIGQTDFSQVLCVKTVKDAPTGFVMTTRTHSSLFVNWNDSSDINYYILEIADNRDFTDNQTINIPANATSFIVDELEENTTYYAKLASFDTDGDTSPFTNVSSLTTFKRATANLSIPSNTFFNQTFQLNATESVGHSIEIHWGDDTHSESNDSSDNWLFTHSYQDQGNYNINVIISELGNYYSIAQTLSINVLADTISWTCIGAASDEYDVKMVNEQMFNTTESAYAFLAHISYRDTQNDITPSDVESLSYTLYRKGRINGQRKEIVPHHHIIWRGSANSVLPTCHNIPPWTLDNIGYNFRNSPDNHKYPLFSSSGYYDLEYVIQLATGNPIVLNFSCIVN